MWVRKDRDGKIVKEWVVYEGRKVRPVDCSHHVVAWRRQKQLALYRQEIGRPVELK